MSDLIRTSSAARILGVSIMTVTRWGAEGKFSGAIVDGLRLWHKGEVEALAGRRAKAKAALEGI